MPSETDHPEKGTDRWIAELRSSEIGDPRWRTAVASLSRLGHEVAPSLIEALGHPKLSVNVGAANALKEIGTAVFYDLRESLEHENPKVRSHAAQLLYGSAVREDTLVEAVSSLTDALGDPDPDVRKWSAVALERIGEEAREAIPALIETLKDDDGYVREWAAKALGSIGPAADEAIPSLTEALIDDEPGVRESASEAIDTIQRENRDS